MGSKGSEQKPLNTTEGVQLEALRLLWTVRQRGPSAEPSFRKLYTLFRHPTLAYLMSPRVHLTEDEAQEVYQDTMKLVWDKAKSFSPEGSATVRTWICAIAKNVALHAKRRRAPDSSNSRLAAEFTDTEDDASGQQLPIPSTTSFQSSPEDEVAQRERLEKCLTGLSGDEQAVLRLLHAPIISYEELADLLEVPLGTVKSRFNSAMQKLKRCWGLVEAPPRLKPRVGDVDAAEDHMAYSTNFADDEIAFRVARSIKTELFRRFAEAPGVQANLRRMKSNEHHVFHEDLKAVLDAEGERLPEDYGLDEVTAEILRGRGLANLLERFLAVFRR
jgi:RNA polymerase sigma-70 factor, ECF subfamily